MTAPWVSSESTAKIVPAFVEALQTVEDVKRNKKVAAGAMQFSYADLAAVLEATKTVLATNGLAVTQSASDNGVQTTLLHTSGEWLAFPPLTIGAAQNTPQARGSAISYARRYSMLAVLGIATEDDDGKAASTAPKTRVTRQPTVIAPEGAYPDAPVNPGKLASRNQITRLQIRLKEVGIVTRETALLVYAAFIGRTVESSKQMTVTELTKVLDGLDLLEAEKVELVANDDGTLKVKEVA